DRMTQEVDVPIRFQLDAGIKDSESGTTKCSKTVMIDEVCKASVQLVHEPSSFLMRDFRRRGAKRLRMASSASSIDVGPSSAPSILTRAYSARAAAAARTSPCMPLAKSDLINARCLLIRRVRPSSRTVISSLSSAARSLTRFKLPFGRPLGFPDLPGLNWLAFGGRP